MLGIIVLVILAIIFIGWLMEKLGCEYSMRNL